MTGIWKFANKDYKINYKHAQRFKGKYEYNEDINGNYKNKETSRAENTNI